MVEQDNRRRRRRRVAAVGGSLLLATALAAGGAEPESPEERAARLQWFTEARYGLMVHWGVYALLGGEWNGMQAQFGGENVQDTLSIPWPVYTAFAPQFDPQAFDAEAWVAAARAGGMRYLVITARHHDGFSLYDSTHSDWDMSRSPWLAANPDPLEQLADACRAQGLRFAIYYSLQDWYHHGHGSTGPFVGITDEQQRHYVRDQVTEMIERYDPDLLWFDAQWLDYWSKADGRALYEHVRALKPALIVNNRVGKADPDDGDYVSTERAMAPPGVDYLWEAAYPINESWGYRHFDQAWKSPAALVHSLAYTASRGANYLLNVGPTAEGAIPGPALDRLAAVGAWLDVHGDAIYGTAASPFDAPPWGWATALPGRLHLLVAEWPADGLLRVPRLENAPLAAYRWGDPRTLLPLDASGAEEWVVSLQGVTPDPLATVIVLEVEGVPQAPPPREGTLLNDTDARITYGPGFIYMPDRPHGDHEDDVHASYFLAPNDGSIWLELEFWGHGIGYVTERHASHGRVDVYLDGQLVETADTGHPTIRMPQVEVFRELGLPLGTHRIKLVKRSGQYMVLDAFRVYGPASAGSPPPAVHVERVAPGWPETPR